MLHSLIINEMGHIKSRTYRITPAKHLCLEQYIRHLFYHKTPRIQTSKCQSTRAYQTDGSTPPTPLLTIGRSGDILPHGSHHHDKQHTDESGVARLNREAGGAGAVSPLCQRSNLQKTSLGKPGKAQKSDELEPRGLPDRRSPSDLRATGRGSVSCAGSICIFAVTFRRRFYAL